GTLGDRSHNAHRSPALRSRPAPSFRAFDGHHERLARIERAPQPGDERAYALAVGAEVTDGGAHRPWGPLQRERHFQAGQRAAQPPQAVHAGLAAPANRAGAGAGGDPPVPYLGQILARPFQHQGLVGARQGAEPQVRQHDHTERPEPAGGELREVVARDVLHYAPAAVYQAAVAGDEGDAEQVVAHRAEPLPQWARRRRRDHRAERAAGEPRPIEREPGTTVGALLAEPIAAEARRGGPAA